MRNADTLLSKPRMYLHLSCSLDYAKLNDGLVDLVSRVFLSSFRVVCCVTSYGLGISFLLEEELLMACQAE